MKGREWRCRCCDCSGSIEEDSKGDRYIKTRSAHGLCERCYAFVAEIKGGVRAMDAGALTIAMQEIERIAEEFAYWSSVAKELRDARTRQ